MPFVHFTLNQDNISNFKHAHLQEAVYYSPHNLNPTEQEVATKFTDDIPQFQSVDARCICNESFDEVWAADKEDSEDDGMCCCRAKGLIYFLEVIVLGEGGIYNQVFINEKPEPNQSRDWAKSFCSICNKNVERNYWCGFWNNWEGAARQGGNGTQCYAPANGNNAFIDEGTYVEIREDIAGNPNLGFYWKYGSQRTDICTHLPPP